MGALGGMAADMAAAASSAAADWAAARAAQIERARLLREARAHAAADGAPATPPHPRPPAVAPPQAKSAGLSGLPSPGSNALMAECGGVSATAQSVAHHSGVARGSQMVPRRAPATAPAPAPAPQTSAHAEVALLADLEIIVTDLQSEVRRLAEELEGERADKRALLREVSALRAAAAGAGSATQEAFATVPRSRTKGRRRPEWNADSAVIRADDAEVGSSLDAAGSTGAERRVCSQRQTNAQTTHTQT